MNISGAIGQPGVYRLSNDAKVYEVIELAGGFHKDADLEYLNRELNLARDLVDQDLIFIPFLNNNSGYSSDNSKISISSASKSELETLPGIGSSTADKIINNRPYKKIEDLLNVSGIGDSKFNQIRDFVTL